MRVGGYEVVSELGAGAMGKVYLAERDGARAAVKVVHPHLLRDGAVVERFKREAAIGQRLDHPNVVRTLDVGDDFIAMEYVEGRDLRALLEALGTVPEALVREIAAQVAAGLQAIHDAGIVHRDLKPENVLITEANEVRITDLGVAKLQEASVVLTMEGEIAGSIGYTAPEQFDFQEVAPASDLYSLGVLLYELATGTNPFLADTLPVVIQRHLQHTPPRALEANPDVTPLLSEMLATLLAKRPADRFAAAANVRAVLEEGEAGAWWRSRETGRDQARVRVRRETALYGRDRELARLHEAWEAGGLVVVEGEPGIGKTRLVADYAAGLSDAQVLYGAFRRGGALQGERDAIELRGVGRRRRRHEEVGGTVRAGVPGAEPPVVVPVPLEPAQQQMVERAPWLRDRRAGEARGEVRVRLPSQKEMRVVLHAAKSQPLARRLERQLVGVLPAARSEHRPVRAEELDVLVETRRLRLPPHLKHRADALLVVVVHPIDVRPPDLVPVANEMRPVRVHRGIPVDRFEPPHAVEPLPVGHGYGSPHNTQAAR